MSSLEPRPHDLLWVGDPAALRWHGDLPEWCAQWLGAPTPVVVRREDTGDAGLLPVGIRGVGRHQRQAAYLAADGVARIVRPEDLAPAMAGNFRSGGCTGIGADTSTGMRAKARMDACMHSGSDRHIGICAGLDALGLPWGPTGGMGFALATGLPVLHPGSDIDIVVRAPAPLSESQVSILAAVIEQSKRPVDLQVDTGRGGFSFNEWLARGPGGRRSILLKTGAGPMLVRDPWEPVSVHTPNPFSRQASSLAPHSVSGPFPHPAPDRVPGPAPYFT